MLGKIIVYVLLPAKAANQISGVEAALGLLRFLALLASCSHLRHLGVCHAQSWRLNLIIQVSYLSLLDTPFIEIKRSNLFRRLRRMIGLPYLKSPQVSVALFRTD